MSLTSYQTAPPRDLERPIIRAIARNATGKFAPVQPQRTEFRRALRRHRNLGCVWLSARVFCLVSQNSSTQPGKILVGTASWSDPGFVERWYPPKLPAADRLPWYADHFNMVEVNSSFYAIPDSRMVERWCHVTPNEFTFNFKLHRVLSRHAAAVKSLPPALQQSAQADDKGRVTLTPKLERALLEEIIGSTESLRATGKFGVFLLQLSPAFSPRKHALTELEGILRRLGPLGLVVELRNGNWTEGETLVQTLDLFRRQHIALSLVDAPPEAHFTIMPSDLDEITNPHLTYLRLHGRNADAYLRGKTVADRFNYDYSDKEIDEVAERAKKLARGADQVHVVFNNNALDFAPHAALRLRTALGQIMKGRARQADLFR
jgi:uncharacterized protein YecE (DUF72 family)